MILKLVQNLSPHVAVFVASIIYIIVGAFFFQIIEQTEIKRKSFDISDIYLNSTYEPLTKPTGRGFDSYWETIVFTFITLTTIGWGNHSPKTAGGRVFCIFYAAFGIPLIMMAIGDIGKFINNAIWNLLFTIQNFCHNRFGWNKRVVEVDADHSSTTLPVGVIVLLVIVHSLIGAIFFMYEQEHITFVDSLYFSFISITTIGYGDYHFTKPSLAPLGLVYLVLGIALMTTFVTALSDWLNYLHHFGKRVKGAEHAEVWLGNEKMSVRELLTSVGKTFGKSDEEIIKVMGNLDQTLQEAVNLKSNIGSPAPLGRRRTVSCYAKTPPTTVAKMPAWRSMSVAAPHNVTFYTSQEGGDEVNGPASHPRKVHPTLSRISETDAERGSQDDDHDEANYITIHNQSHTVMNDNGSSQNTKDDKLPT